MKIWEHSDDARRTWRRIEPAPRSVIANLDIPEGHVWDDGFGNLYRWRDRSMNRYVVTFQQRDPDRRNSYTVVHAHDTADAHLRAFSQYGHNWARVYDTEEAAGVEQFELKEIPWGS